jgi:hypothetical protein
MKINSRSSVKDIETALKETGVLPNYDWAYAKDQDHQRAYDDLTTPEEVEKFLAALDQDNKELTKPPFQWGCTKARLIRQYLQKPFWIMNMARMKAAISHNRRVCCSCHETGSFAKRTH